MKSKPKTSEEAVTYPVSTLVKCKALSHYQKDFVKACLTDPEYTIEDAISVLEARLKEEVN
jgi:hypothetical protein